MAPEQPNNLSRRDFLRVTGVSSLSAALLGLGARLPALAALELKPAAAASHPAVVLHAYDPAQTVAAAAVREALLAATDLSWLHEGDSVFVKVASNSDIVAPAVTSPDVLAGVVEVLREAGAGTIYVGDMSGAFFVRHLPEETIGSTRANMVKNGLLAAAEATGATIHCFEEVPYAQAFITELPVCDIAFTGDHGWSEGVEVAAILDEVDHVVNLPRLGKHVLAGASLGLKNAVGWISDHSRGVLHRDGETFHEKVAAINAIPQLQDKMRLTLTLVDQALTTYGPDNGYKLPLAQPLVIASADVVAHDDVALQTLLWTRQQIPADALAEDPYPAESNGMNWWFVRTYWGEDFAANYQTLSTVDLRDTAAPSQINFAYDMLHGGRPASLDVVTGGLPLAENLLELLGDIPNVNLL